jgi:hypothetical protein
MEWIKAVVGAVLGAFPQISAWLLGQRKKTLTTKRLLAQANYEWALQAIDRRRFGDAYAALKKGLQQADEIRDAALKYDIERELRRLDPWVNPGRIDSYRRPGIGREVVYLPDVQRAEEVSSQATHPLYRQGKR